MVDLLSAHVTHQWVDIDRLELFAAKEARSLLTSVRALPGVQEVALLKTCNRVELYTATDDVPATDAALRELTGGYFPEDLNGSVRYLRGQESVRHLMRVAAGLDSLIVGEDQILGQIKEAYAFAQKQGALGPALDLVFRKAIHVGKKVRTDTAINDGHVSIGSAAVELAERLLGGLQGRTVLVMGAGEMASLVARALAGRDLKAIFVANKTYPRAVEMAQQLGGLAIHFEDLGRYVPMSDVVIAATAAPHVVLSRGELLGMLKIRPAAKQLLIIDLGNPRNVDEAAGEIVGVELRNLDGLRAIAEENIERRRVEMRAAETIIDTEMPHLLQRFAEEDGEALTKRLYQRSRAAAAEEATTLLQRLDALDEEGQEAVEAFAWALTKRLLAEPTLALKEASRQGNEALLRAAQKLFGLEE